MSRKSKTATPQTPTSSDPGALPSDAADRSALDRQKERDAMQLIKRMRSELGASGGFVTLERRNPMFNMMKFAGLGVQIDINELSIEYVATTFGGGDYIARGRTRGGTFENEQRIEFTIDHTIPPKNPLAGDAKKETPAPSIDPQAIMREAREEARQNSNAMMELTKTVLSSQQNQGPVMEMMKFMFDAQQKAEQRHAEDLRKSEERFGRLITTLQDSRQTNSPRSLRDQIEEAKELIDMLGGGRGSDEKESFWKEFGKGIAEVAAPMLKQHFAGAVGPVIHGPRAQLAAPSPLTSAPASEPKPANPETAGPSADNGAAAGEEMKNPFITAALNRFRVTAIDAARKGKDPFEFVDNLIGMVPESYHSLIFNTANAADWFGRIFGNDAEAINHAPFLGEVRNSILAKAFIAHAIRSAAAGIEPLDTAKTFFEWSTKDFDDALAAMAEESENWSTAFEGIQIDAPWLEQLRKAVVEQLDDAPAPNVAKVVDLPVTARASGTGSASQKTRAAKS